MMPYEPQENGVELYDHYSRFPAWLEEETRERIAGAIRCLRRIATALKTLKFPESSMPVAEFEQSTGLAEMEAKGYSLRCDAFYVLDSKVHGLPVVWKELELYRDESWTPPPIPYRNDYASLPNASPLFDQADVPKEWMLFFRRLVDEYRSLDVMIGKLALKVDIKVGELASLCFHGCLLATSLHQAMSILSLANAHGRAYTQRGTELKP